MNTPAPATPQPGGHDRAPGRISVRRNAPIAAAATLASVVAFVGGYVVRGGDETPPVPAMAPTAQPLSGSGAMGPWQTYGHSQSPPEVSKRVAANSDGVLLVGDSVAARIREPLQASLAKKSRMMSWDHWNGRPTHGAADSLVSLRAAGHLPRTVVVVSGEKDIFETSLFAQQVERIMRDTSSQTKVFWVMPEVQRPGYAKADAANAALLRSDLRAAAARHPHLHLVDWAGHLAMQSPATQKMWVPDGVHPSPHGQEQLVYLITQAITRP